MSIHTNEYYQSEVRKGFALRHHEEPILKIRNRLRTKYALGQLKTRRNRKREHRTPTAPLVFPGIHQ